MTCDPCEYCINFKVYPGDWETPDDYECLVGEDWNENGVRVCHGFRPKFASDSLFEQLEDEYRAIYYLEEEMLVRMLRDEEIEYYAEVERITVDEAREINRKAMEE